MRVAVQGLWHLGSVTAGCLTAAGHDVVGFDDDAATIEGLLKAEPPISEPGLAELVRAGLETGKLQFTADASAALTGAEILWITYDTPVDENDVADLDFVIGEVRRVLPKTAIGCLIVVSSQLPVGSVAGLEAYARSIGREDLRFACSPENLRLGNAIEVFRKPDRVVLGVRRDADAETFRQLMSPITAEVLVMGVESAEMTKHAINSFLAMSVAFANEIATLCEVAGADAGEVAKGLKSEHRIGPRAYLGPGAAFAGGTLARDISFLTARGQQGGLELELIPAVATSNDRHRAWPLNRLRSQLGDLTGRRVAILGLTYKPGTDTLRRSSSIELARAVSAAGARVQAYDPALRSIPVEFQPWLDLRASAQSAISGSDAVVIGTVWPEFQALDWQVLSNSMVAPIVIDATGLLAATFAVLPEVTYSAVGRVTRPVAGAQI